MNPSSETPQGALGVGTVSCDRDEDRRIECIEAILRDPLEANDARRAAINAAAADLLLIGCRLAGSINSAVSDREVDLEEWDDLAPAVSLLAVVNRLVTQFDHVDRRLTELEQPNIGVRKQRRIRSEKSPK
jgi:hypothetical protein